MRAKNRNISHRLLFTNGGRLDLLTYGTAELNRQMDELRAERRTQWRQEYGERPCPCGCGEPGACDTYLAQIAATDDLPF